jgi:hypothetical protein
LLHRLRRALLAAVAACALLGLAQPASAATPHTDLPAPTAGTWLSGAHEQVGPANWTNFGTWRGRPVDVAVDFTNAPSWSSLLDSPRWLADKHAGLSAHFVLSMQPWPTGMDSTGKPLADMYRCASRYYDSYYTQMAKNLVAYGYRNATIRLAWEQTGFWFPWGRQTWNGYRNQDFYGSCWRNIWRAMEAVNPAFTWDWNISDQHVDPTPWYPGDAYVDYVGGDFYDIGVANKDDHTGSVYQELHGAYTADYMASFARAHHKPLAITEWGLVWKCPSNTSYQWQGGDDPYYVQSMRDWFTSNRDILAWESYFDGADGPCHSDVLYRDWLFPSASALYRSLW